MTTLRHDVIGGSGAMFDRIADRYDRLNRILSFGLDRGWRKRAINALQLSSETRVLDVATGTGDIAIAIARHCPGARVTGVDPSVKMLAVGTGKITAGGLGERVSLQLGDAQQLDFPDHSFDSAVVAFGIRNIPNRALALREIARVVRPGGRLAVLELSEPSSTGIWGNVARFYLHVFVPRIGAWLSKAAEYRYLQRSIAAFPPARQFVGLMEDNGWTSVSFTSLTFGVVQLYVGTVPYPSAEVVK
ncbi:MAG: bifunctional demethylmenaquinone methyltransferase/2-methoxy-6-polyprenyl-1,4-benzoquinol methylase UbiE [Myxococcales bacterium]|nr:bifunctional demethylmenaquinone methyltransferase/2-methoxy-6-polyprenyl-1,4-benzoquinol methylase UbiE [Myxococcales bacterium]